MFQEVGTAGKIKSSWKQDIAPKIPVRGKKNRMATKISMEKKPRHRCIQRGGRKYGPVAMKN